MADDFKRVGVKATQAGAPVHTVPTGESITIIGCRGANTDGAAVHTFHVEINGFLITGKNTKLAIGGALDAMVGSKIVAEGDDVITAYADADNQVDVWLSYMKN